jgi:hypothetical protein
MKLLLSPAMPGKAGRLAARPGSAVLCPGPDQIQARNPVRIGGSACDAIFDASIRGRGLPVIGRDGWPAWATSSSPSMTPTQPYNLSLGARSAVHLTHSRERPRINNHTPHPPRIWPGGFIPWLLQSRLTESLNRHTHRSSSVLATRRRKGGREGKAFSCSSPPADSLARIWGGGVVAAER